MQNSNGEGICGILIFINYFIWISNHLTGRKQVPVERIKWDFQNIPYGPDTSQKFDMVCKKKDVHAIVYIHGGAYFMGNRAQYP